MHVLYPDAGVSSALSDRVRWRSLPVEGYQHPIDFVAQKRREQRPHLGDAAVDPIVADDLYVGHTDRWIVVVHGSSSRAAPAPAPAPPSPPCPVAGSRGSCTSARRTWCASAPSP